MRIVSVLTVFLLSTLSLSAYAQWSDDPAVNLPIVERPGEQVIPKIAGSDDVYIGWFDNASGNYDVYLQYLDSDGVPQFPAGGMLVSSHPQNSSLVDWDLIAYDGDCVLVFADARDGSDLDIHAYRIDSEGNFVWGPDGVTLSANDDFEAAPRVTFDSDLVFVWSRFPDVGDGEIMMQRVSPEGVPQLAAGGMPIVSVPGESPGFPAIEHQVWIPDPPARSHSAGGQQGALLGGVFVSWVRDVSNFASPRHVRLGFFDKTGANLWDAPLDIYDLTSVPIAYTPKLVTNLGGGVVVLWHASEGNLFTSRLQSVDAQGQIGFPEDGIEVSTTSNMHHIDPTVGVSPTGIYVFWNERNSAQSMWGIYGQKITTGRQWGDGGVELQPVDATYKYLPQTGQRSNHTPMVFFGTELSFGNDRILAMQVDLNGNLTWQSQPVEVSNPMSGKSRLRVAGSPVNARMVWEDGRNGTPDVFAQNVNFDGTLGPPPTTGIPTTPAPPRLRLAQNRPNPFTASTGIPLSLDGVETATLSIHDAYGRLVRTFGVNGAASAITWDGADQRGVAVPAGVYFYRLEHAGGSTEPRRAVIVR